MDQVVIKTVDDWETLATRVVDLCVEQSQRTAGAVPVVLSGDLGAGKTTFSQAVARQLGVREVVQSPTFVIMKSYETSHAVFAHFVHMDAYRIDTEAELRPLRFAELLETPRTLMFIEWGERIATALPLHTLHISINHQTDDIRVVTISYV